MEPAPVGARLVSLFRPSRSAALFVLAIVGAALLATGATARRGADRLTIFAASSLTEAFTAFDPAQRYSFGSSGTLETQITQGAPADVFASASPVNTQRLFSAGLVERPVAFTANRLALIVPRANPAGIGSVADLRHKRVKLVIAAQAVPVGAYTRQVLRRLGLLSVLSNVVSREADAKAVTGKVALGQADAGFVYVTDARAVADRVTVIPIPARAQPHVVYEVAVVAASSRRTAARGWIKGLVGRRGQSALRAAGFLRIRRDPS